MGKTRFAIAAAIMAAGGLAALVASGEGKDPGESFAKSGDTTVVTNDNGSVVKTVTETTVQTNGSFVTERRRETRTTEDKDGNVLCTSTSESSRSFTDGAELLLGPGGRLRATGAMTSMPPRMISGDEFSSLFDRLRDKMDEDFRCVFGPSGEDGLEREASCRSKRGEGKPPAPGEKPAAAEEAKDGGEEAASAGTPPAPGAEKPERAQPGVEEANASFLGVKFGETPSGGVGAYEADPAEPNLLRAAFKPETPLDSFDSYFVYVTPKTHRTAKVVACSRNAVAPTRNWSRHYLVEAIEKRYGAWAKPYFSSRPYFVFDIGRGRCVTLCLAGASADFETVIAACDAHMERLAAHEMAAIRREERAKAASEAEKARKTNVENALKAF